MAMSMILAPVSLISMAAFVSFLSRIYSDSVMFVRMENNLLNMA